MAHSGRWRHTCIVCWAIFFGPRCRIVCPSCYAAKGGRACGRCYECGAAVPFRPKATNKGPLFCDPCEQLRREDSIRRAHRFHHVSRTVVEPIYEESVSYGL